MSARHSLSMRFLQAGKDPSLNVKGAYPEGWADMLGMILKQGFGGLEPDEMVAEIKERITDELDYSIEACNQAV